MSIRTFTLPALAIVLCSVPLVALAHGDSRQTIGTKVDQMYPDFLLPKLDGTMGRLSDYRGKKLLLIHFASW